MLWNLGTSNLRPIFLMLRHVAFLVLWEAAKTSALPSTPVTYVTLRHGDDSEVLFAV